MSRSTLVASAVLLAAGCRFTAPKHEDSDTGVVPAGTTPPVLTGPACTSIVGTSSIAVVSFADPTVLVLPENPPQAPDTLAWLAGPDQAGRYYLAEATGVLKRSDDLGCTWTPIGSVPVEFERQVYDTGSDVKWYEVLLFADPSTDRLFASGPTPAHGLHVTTDGVAWTRLAEVGAREIAVDRAAPHRLRAFDGRAFALSEDGGVSWTEDTPEMPGAGLAAFHPGNFDTIALGGPDLWVTTDGGQTWSESIPDPWSTGYAAWDEDTLYVVYREDLDLPEQPLRVRRSVDFGVTFDDLPIPDEPDSVYFEVAARNGVLVATGRRTVDIVQHSLVEIMSDTGSVVHLIGWEVFRAETAQIALSDDRAILGFRGPGIGIDP